MATAIILCDDDDNEKEEVAAAVYTYNLNMENMNIETANDIFGGFLRAASFH